MPEPRVQLLGLSKKFRPRGGIEVLRDISLQVDDGEFIVVVGASGCGKTTLLNLVAGFEKPTSGAVLVNGRPVEGPGPDRMMIFQEPALFPWLTVLGNVEFGLRGPAWPDRLARRERALEFLNMVGLTAFRDARVHELSGGMKQRVALARALAPGPSVLLFDEPFGSLDALTRERLYAELQAVFAREPKTAVFVTHNVREAACLGDRVLVLSAAPGRIKAVVPVGLPRPRDFYDPEVSRLGGCILAELRANEDEKTLATGAVLPAAACGMADGV